MVDFIVKMRHYCRNRRCRSKLSRMSGKRFVVVAITCRSTCTAVASAKARSNRDADSNASFARSRNARAHGGLRPGFGRYLSNDPSDASIALENLDSMRVESPHKAGRPARSCDRATLIRNAVQTEFFGGGQWREFVSTDGVPCYVTRLWGKEPQAESQRLAA